MGHLRPAPEKENPESVAAESGVQGIEALPKRVSRYGQAKTDALDVAKYMREWKPPSHGRKSGFVWGLPDVPQLLHRRSSSPASGIPLQKALALPSLRDQKGR